jgi:ABC-type nitrate/sulfonate/bicarbonate transport system substrate-binding protein
MVKDFKGSRNRVREAKQTDAWIAYVLLTFFVWTLFLLPASARGQEKKVVRVGFASVSWDTQLPVCVAMAKGFYKAQGIAIEHIFIRGGSALLAALVAGDPDFADGGAQAPIRARARW